MVTMMARSITVERSGTALPGLARVSGLGMGMGIALGFFLEPRISLFGVGVAVELAKPVFPFRCFE